MTHYMTFKLGNELFALNVAPVWEVLVVNVRGKAIPVVDLRVRFGLEPAIETVHTRIVVMELLIDGEVTVLGGIADSLHEVIELDASNFNPPPSIAMRWRSQFIQGMGRRGEDFIIILDVDAVFASDGLASVIEASGERGGIPAFTGQQPESSLAV